MDGNGRQLGVLVAEAVLTADGLAGNAGDDRASGHGIGVDRQIAVNEAALDGGILPVHGQQATENGAGECDPRRMSGMRGFVGKGRRRKRVIGAGREDAGGGEVCHVEGAGHDDLAIGDVETGTGAIGIEEDDITQLAGAGHVAGDLAELAFEDGRIDEERGLGRRERGVMGVEQRTLPIEPGAGMGVQEPELGHLGVLELRPAAQCRVETG